MSASNYKRTHQVGELIQHELANVITNELKDPRVGFVTVTEVRVTGDLRNARVYVSIYGSQEQRNSSLEGLRTAAGYLKHILAQRLELRFIPELSFECDESLDRAERLETVMQAIAKGETQTPAHETTEPLAAETYRSELAIKRQSFAAERKRNNNKASNRGVKRRRRKCF
ncbi:MAG: 30S ribosome-binding factor RbfA [Deltaproteobacteria bacterium]|nr:30S ribosome-binding factor RbfA [Deltaproteobacteria bacterium]